MDLRIKKTPLRKPLFLLTAASAFIFSTAIGYGADERVDPVVLNAKVLNILKEQAPPVTTRVQKLAARIIEEKKTFFLSYCWAKEYCTKPMVDDFELFIQRLGITEYYRDVRKDDGLGMTPGVDIEEFMKKAKGSDVVIIFLNDAYLRSRNCMYEFSQIWDAQNQKIAPNVFIIKHPESPSIFGGPAKAVSYADHWQKEIDKLREVKSTPANRKWLRAEEDNVSDMCDSMPSIIHQLSLHILAPYADLRQSGFEDVFKVALPDERHRLMEEIGDEQKQNARLRELVQEAEVAQRAEGDAKQKDKEYQEADILRRVEEAEQRRIHEREEAELMERKRLLAIRESMIEECINTYRQLTGPNLTYGQLYEMMTKVFQGYDDVKREEPPQANRPEHYMKMYEVWGVTSAIGFMQDWLNLRGDDTPVRPTWARWRRDDARKVIQEDLLATMGKYEGLYKHTHPRREEIAKM